MFRAQGLGFRVQALGTRNPERFTETLEKRLPALQSVLDARSGYEAQGPSGSSD